MDYGHEVSGVGFEGKQNRQRKVRLKIDPLTREQVVVLLDAVTEHDDFQMYVLHLAAVRTGLRVGELFAFEWGDLDFASRFIEVRRSIC